MPEKQVLEERVYLVYTHTFAHHQRKPGQELIQGRNPEAGTEVEAIEEHWLLASFGFYFCKIKL